MSKIEEIQFSLFENAINSLEVGIAFYLDENLKMGHKHAILNIFHSIELLLKERLFRESAVYIFREANEKLISEKSRTIDFFDIEKRYKKLNINLERDEWNLIKSVKNKRNAITHYKFKLNNKQDADELGRCLKFIFNFLEKHLDTRLKDEINSNLYSEIEEIVDAFEVRYGRAVEKANELTTAHHKDDLCSDMHLLECPECGTETLTCVNGVAECTLCEDSNSYESCSYCGEPNMSMTDAQICSTCFDRLMDKDD